MKSNSHMQMLDPLVLFNWKSLHQDYDDLCKKKFDPSVPFLYSLSPRPGSDRSLYYSLVERFAHELNSPTGITIGTYEAMLYWKLYSQPAAVANTCKGLRQSASLQDIVSRALNKLSAQLRGTAGAISARPLDQVQGLGLYGIWGMKSSTALPVRTTFLHFVEPSAMPIFDKQVLLAVGVKDKKANEKIAFLQLYLPHARTLASRYSNCFAIFKTETPIRLIDMALWVVRGGC